MEFTESEESLQVDNNKGGFDAMAFSSCGWLSPYCRVERGIIHRQNRIQDMLSGASQKLTNGHPGLAYGRESWYVS